MKMTDSQANHSKEAGYPVDARGRPELRYYTDSLEYYIQMYGQHLGALQGKKGVGYEIELAFSRRVHGMWGLVACPALIAVSLHRGSCASALSFPLNRQA
jgi:hypothetical protein